MLNLSFLTLFEITCSDRRVHSTSVRLTTHLLSCSIQSGPLTTRIQQDGQGRTSETVVFMLTKQVQERLNSQVLILDVLMTCYMALNYWIWKFFFFMSEVEKHILCKEGHSLRTSGFNGIKILHSYFREIW